MKKIITRISILASVVCMALASHLSALTLADSLGTYTPPEPADAASEVTYINNLVSATAVSPNTEVIDGVTYSRINPNPLDPMPVAVVAGSVKVDSEISPGVPNPEFDPTAIDVSGFDYLIGKYDGPNGGGIVWYVGDLDGNQSIPTTGFGSFGLSHYSLYNPGGNGVPDGGTTVALLGLALGLVAVARRKFGV